MIVLMVLLVALCAVLDTDDIFEDVMEALEDIVDGL